MRLSLQTYTVRDLLARDFAGTMKSLAKIGYQAVEIGFYGDKAKAADAKKVFDTSGLTVSGAHAGIEALETKLDAVLAEASFFGYTDIICPWMPEDRRKTADGWKKSAEALTKVGRACGKAGFTFSYHNHSFEFQQFDGKSGFDILWENADADAVRSELDTYWVQHGGADPVAYMNKLGKRVQVLHLKDMAAGPDKRFAPVGAGILDFPAILAAGKKLGIAWAAVEQDLTYETPALEAVTVSLENLKRMGM